MKRAILLVIVLVFTSVIAKPQLPEGFVQETANDDVFLPVGILFPTSETTIVWDLFGQVWAYPNDEFDWTPDIDIRE